MFVKIGKGNQHVCCLHPTKSKDEAYTMLTVQWKVLDQPLEKYLIYPEECPDRGGSSTHSDSSVSLGRHQDGHHVAILSFRTLLPSLHQLHLAE